MPMEYHLAKLAEKLTGHPFRPGPGMTDHPPQFAVGGVAVHLARMRHEDDEALVLQGEAA